MKTINELTYELNGAAMEVHRELGPVLLESVYEAAILLINFNVPILKNGIRRFVNNFSETSASSALYAVQSS